VGKERLAELIRRTKSKRADAGTKTLVAQLERVQEYIEAFCEGEQIFPGNDPDSGDPVPFTEWSQGIIERIATKLKSCAGMR